MGLLRFTHELVLFLLGGNPLFDPCRRFFFYYAILSYKTYLYIFLFSIFIQHFYSAFLISISILIWNSKKYIVKLFHFDALHIDIWQSILLNFDNFATLKLFLPQFFYNLKKFNFRHDLETLTMTLRSFFTYKAIWLCIIDEFFYSFNIITFSKNLIFFFSSKYISFLNN